MKKILVSLALLSVVTNVRAVNEFRYLENKAGGYIFFTYTYCVWKATGERVPNQFYVYSTNGTGVTITDGCYEYKAPFYIINWNGGGNTSINVNNTASIK